MSWNKEKTEKALFMKTLGSTYNEIVDALNKTYPDEHFTFDGVRNKLRRLKNNKNNNDINTLSASANTLAKQIDKYNIDIKGHEYLGAKDTKNAINLLKGVPEYPEEKLNTPETYSRKQDGTVDSSFISDYNTEDLQNDEKLLKTVGLDSEKYEIQNVKVSNWEQNSNSKGLKTLHSIKITAKKRVVISEAKLIETLTKKVNPFISHSTSEYTNNRNLVIPLADLHFGITKIDDLTSKLLSLGKIMKDKNYKVVAIEQLGDLFHSSLMKKTQTQKGTILDDVDMVEAIEDAKTFYDAIIRCALAHSQEVHIYHTEGNHSGNMEYMFLEYLEAKYPEVKVFNNNDYRYYYQLDNVGFMIAHGDYAKKGLPMLFANEADTIWSSSTSREIHTGHFHSEKTVDHDGVMHRQFGTMKPNDPYEVSNGYTMNKKELQVLEYDANSLKVTYNL